MSSLIQNSSGITVTLDPALALLSIDIENFPPLMRKMVTYIVFAARISLAREWRSQSPPKIEEVISRVNAQYTMEKLLAYKERRALVFHRQWKKW